MTEVVTRFAPSPTGYLHIGGVRTALYGWLYARQKGGRFILRIEDTDAERSTAESVAIVIESMRWLGLDWDEGPEVGGPHGPYFQSERKALYASYASMLVAAGHAYRCYATKEDIQAAREAHEKTTGAKHGFRFKSPWRDGAAAPSDPSAKFVVRFRAPESGMTAFDDLVRGRIEVPNDAQQDFVLLRGDGLPLYNFGCAVDDLEMGVTLAARGDDHIVNTPPQILLFEALGAKPPVYAHLPMVLAPNGEKLSKRHAAVGVLEYRDMGYFPDAVLNYLARLGWSHGDQEIFTRAEMIAKFDWAHVGSTAGKYDAKKFAFVQGEHLRMLPDDALAAAVIPFLEKRGLRVDSADRTLVAAMAQLKPRAVSLVELAEGLDYFFREPPDFDEAAKKKQLVPAVAPRLRELAELLAGVEPFEPGPLEAAMTAWLEREGLAMKDVAQAARVAMTGRTKSPGLFDVMILLGRDRALARIRRGAELAEQGG